MQLKQQLLHQYKNLPYMKTTTRGRHILTLYEDTTGIEVSTCPMYHHYL